MATRDWEDELYKRMASGDPLEDVCKDAAERAEDLDEEDLAEEITDKAGEAQRALDDLQDSLYELTQLEKKA